VVVTVAVVQVRPVVLVAVDQEEFLDVQVEQELQVKDMQDKMVSQVHQVNNKLVAVAVAQVVQDPEVIQELEVTADQEQTYTQL
jgi:hypothetical protein